MHDVRKTLGPRSTYCSRFLDLVEQGIGSYLHMPQNKYQGSGKSPETSTKTTFTSEAATEQGTLSQQQEVDKNSGDKNTREDRNNQQGECTSGNDFVDSRSDSCSDSRSSSTSSVKSMLQSWNNNQWGQLGQSVEQEK